MSEWAGVRGFGIVGAVDSAAYDRAQPPNRRTLQLKPDCDTILLLGTGGTDSWSRVSKHHGGPVGRARAGHHPIDAWSRTLAQEVSDWLGRAGYLGRIVHPDDPVTLNFRSLAEMMGLGVTSPVIGHLLHPTYGPWVSFRAGILLSGQPFGPRPEIKIADFDPCTGCAQPCVTACPAGTYELGGAATHLDRCGSWRAQAGCESGCETLRACPIGLEHRYQSAEESFRHAHGTIAIKRYLRESGPSLWRRLFGWR